MPAPTETKCCCGGNCSQTPTSDSLREWDLTYWTSTDPVQCPICKNFSAQIGDTLDLWSARAKESIYIFNLSQTQETVQDSSGATAIIVALADTWSHHLQFTHPGGSTIGMTRETGPDPFQWYLKFYRKSF